MGGLPDPAAEAAALASGLLVAPVDHVSAAQAQSVRFYKALADTVWALQQLRPDELAAGGGADGAGAGAGSGGAGAGTGLARALALEAGAEAQAGGVLAGAAAAGGGLARILALGRDLQRELVALGSATRAEPDYAAAYADDAAYPARVNAVVGSEREAPEAALRRGVAAGERRLRNIDAVLAAAVKIVLDEEPRGVAGAARHAPSAFDRLAIVGPGAGEPLVRARRRAAGASAGAREGAGAGAGAGEGEGAGAGAGAGEGAGAEAFIMDER